MPSDRHDRSPRAADVRAEIRALADPDIAKHSQRFFKTGPGDYGEGDRFLGIRVPQIRAIVRRHKDARLSVIRSLIRSEYHEERLFAVLLCAEQTKRATPGLHQRLYDLYVAERAHVNNWDLVDGSAPAVVGVWLRSRHRSPLYRLADSDALWDRRIAVLATLDFIRHDDFATTIDLSERLLADPHDLIHKATGWMLREVGKRNQPELESFLSAHCPDMPRTMLRYAIERLPKDRARHWLEK